MKTIIKITFIISIFFFCNINTVFSQLKVLSDGSVEVDSYVGSWGRANQTKVHYQYSCAYHLFNSYYGTDVFYVRGDGYVWTRNGFLTASDSIFKTNIKDIYSPLEKIKMLRGVTYNRKYFASTQSNDTSHSNASNKTTIKKQETGLKEYGLIAQEVKKIIPEVVHIMSDSTLAISYIDIIPLLIEAIKEQQLAIDHLQNEVQKVKLDENYRSGAQLTNIQNNATQSSNRSTLSQNKPNPFNQTTEINYFVPENTQSANIFIYDLNGTQIKCIPVKNIGKGSITINGNELHAGMYYYVLVVNGQEADSKKMILTN